MPDLILIALCAALAVPALIVVAFVVVVVIPEAIAALLHRMGL